MNTQNINTDWVCTDPDTQQYGRQLTKQMFEFKESGKEALIKLDEYEIKEIEHIINAYGYTLLSGDNKAKGFENIKDLYGEKANWIIAECIFESENN